MGQNLIQQIEAEQMRKDLPDFRPGDTVAVRVKVKEGNKERLQTFEGVVIGKRNRGLNSAFKVRRIAHGVGVERTFQSHSPLIDSIEIKRRGDVRQAKLYYLRDLSGRKARIREKTEFSSERAKAATAENPVDQPPTETESNSAEPDAVAHEDTNP